MTKSFRVVDLRGPLTGADMKMIDARNPETAVFEALGVDAVRSGAKKDLVARVYWQTSPNEPTNMVRMYARLDPDRALANLDRDKHRVG